MDNFQNNIQEITQDTSLNERLRNSYYKLVADIRADHGIYLVQHVNTGKIYIKKVLKIYNRSIYEHLLSANISGIPKIYALYEDSNGLTIIEEFISGDTLDERLQRGEHFSVNQILEIGIQLCHILQKLHGCNPQIIHRDIKPSNVMQTPRGDIVLIDMNAAKFVDRNKSEDTLLLGTQGFAAPEQYGFAPSDIRTDIYGVGMLLQTLLTGASSESGQNSDPSGQNHGLKNHLEKIISKCTELEPNNRYRTISELQHALEKATNRSAISVNTNTKADNHFGAKHSYPFLPPGFRTLSPIKMLIGIAGYTFLTFFSFSLEPEGSEGAFLIVERILCLLMFLSIVFFSLNYLNIQSRIPFCRSRYIVLRILGILLGDILLIGFWLVMIALIGIAFLL